MRWFCIRPAKIDPQLRKTFERYGTVGMQIALGDMNNFVHQGQPMKASQVLDSVLDWLTEQYDKAERKDTWLLAMEIAITIFVLGNSSWTSLNGAVARTVESASNQLDLSVDLLV